MNLKGILTQDMWGVLALYSWQAPAIAYTTVIPGAPAVGARYLVGVGSAGVWAGQDNNIATWNGAAWVFTVPADGWAIVVLQPTHMVYVFNITLGYWWFANVTARILLPGEPWDVILAAATIGQQFFFAPGTHNQSVPGPVVIGVADVGIYGCGRATTIRGLDAGVPTFQLNVGATRLQMRHLNLDCDRTCLDIRGTNMDFEDIHFTTTSGTATYAIVTVNGVSGLRFIDCTFSVNWLTGTINQVGTAAGKMNFTDCEFNCKFRLTDQTYYEISHCVFNYVLYLEGAAALWWSVENCDFHSIPLNPDNNCITLSGIGDFLGNRLELTPRAGASAFVITGAGTRINVIGNTFRFNGQGFDIQAGRSVIASNICIKNIAVLTGYMLTITGGTNNVNNNYFKFDDLTNPAIGIYITASRQSVSSNIIEGHGVSVNRTAMQLAVGADFSMIDGNEFIGDRTGGVLGWFIGVDVLSTGNMLSNNSFEYVPSPNIGRAIKLTGMRNNVIGNHCRANEGVFIFIEASYQTIQANKWYGSNAAVDGGIIQGGGVLTGISCGNNYLLGQAAVNAIAFAALSTACLVGQNIYRGVVAWPAGAGCLVANNIPM